MENQTFMVVEATPNPEGMEDLQSYGAQAYALLQKHGGVRVAQYGVESATDGGDKPAAYAVFSFPNSDAIQNLLFNDPDYQNIIPLREKAFKSIRYFVCHEQE